MNNQTLESESPIEGSNTRDKSVCHKFLVIEDDDLTQKIWGSIIHAVDARAQIRWTNSGESANKIIHEQHSLKNDFDLVVSDVNLIGELNGIEVWRQHQDGTPLFLFETGLSRKEFCNLIGKRSGLQPFMVQKPLNLNECVETVRSILAFQKTFSRRNTR